MLNKYLSRYQLRTKTDLSSGDLRRNAKATILSDALARIQRRDESFTQLNLQNMMVEEADIQALCDALREYPPHSSFAVNLSHNTLSSASVNTLSTAPIAELDLTSTGITPTDVSELLKNPNLLVLCIKANRLDTLDEKIFQSNTTLHTLDASSNALSGEGINAITNSKSLKTVSLNANALQLSDIKSISFASFIAVTLRNNRLSDHSIQPLIDMQPEWRSLNLDFNAISTTGAEKLAASLINCRISLLHNRVDSSMQQTHPQITVVAASSDNLAEEVLDNKGFDRSLNK